MLITIPAALPGSPSPRSVLDLEPLFDLLRQCRPDAVSLMPSLGPDDLPNGPALAAIKHRLEAEGITAVPGSWRVHPADPVDDPAWKLQSLFDIRAQIAALEEASMSPLIIEWDAPAQEPGALQALVEFLLPVVEEAERAQVRIAVRLWDEPEVVSAALRQIDSPWLGVCYDLRQMGARKGDALRHLEALGSHLFAVQPGRCWTTGADTLSTGSAPWKRLVTTLCQSGFSGPVLLDAVRTPVECGCAVGFIRGILAIAGTRPLPSLSPSLSIATLERG
jgi:sugar phosphate isomerase/epimerase